MKAIFAVVKRRPEKNFKKKFRPVWDLLAQLVEHCTALHQYRRGHGFKSCTGLKFFFQAFFSLLLKKCS